MEQTELLILDGGFGTMLQARGLPAGAAPECWNIENPEAVIQVHREYIDAGSRVIYANTFGANGKKLRAGPYSAAELVAAGVRAARIAAGDEEVRVALDIGPLGALLAPLGELSFDEAYALFREIAVAGERAGADLAVVETMSDLLELKAALLAVKENTRLPVWTTMTFEAGGRTFTGCSVAAFALTATALDADALGFNCSLGPAELLPLVREAADWTDAPLILKPNAGLPDPVTGEYGLAPAEFAAAMREAAALGVTVFGGCCGTTPAYIAALREALADPPAASRPPRTRRGVCSDRAALPFGAFRVIGERINPTGKKRFQQALREHDLDYILNCAVEQEEAGAEILDVNVGLPGIDEAEMMQEVVTALQSVTALPLMLDSSDPAAIEAGLRCVRGRAIVNSVNGDAARLDAILPLCKKYGAAVVGLCADARGLPKTAAERIAIARTIAAAAERCGLDRGDLLIDCLAMTVSAEPEQAAETLAAIRAVSKAGLATVLGVSNISFGLPQREVATAAFLAQAIGAGLRFAIMNPGQRRVMDAAAAARVLVGEDPGCEAYIRRFSAAEDAPAAPVPRSESLADAVLHALPGEVERLTAAALETRQELEVVEELLIPALDEVGRRYEAGTLYLPQLIGAANAASAGFALLRRRLEARGESAVSRGRILLATVRGDVHDIGKNIVATVLRNYGYTVIDLGRDVPPERVAEAALGEGVGLVGLSALMTTTLPAMEETIRALRGAGCTCPVMVGGAVLTAESAAALGADYYARDAKCSADIAREVFGR